MGAEIKSAFFTILHVTPEKIALVSIQQKLWWMRMNSNNIEFEIKIPISSLLFPSAELS